MERKIPPEHLRRVGTRSSRGQKSINEDNALLKDYACRPVLSRFLCLAAVADGMGGPGLGDLASDTAIKLLYEEFNGRRAEYESDPTLNTQDLLAQIFSLINTALLDMLALDPGLRGMGTTLTAFLAEKDRLYIAHIGDSRAYLVRNHNISQLTRDHSMEVEASRKSSGGEEEWSRPTLTVPSRVLGMKENIEVDHLVIPLMSGDTVLLCTKGLYGSVRPEEMLRVITGSPAGMQEACNGLVALAEGRGARDNVTALLWRFPDPARETQAKPARAFAGAEAGAIETERSDGIRYHPGQAVSFWERKINRVLAFSIVLSMAVAGFFLGWMLAS